MRPLLALPAALVLAASAAAQSPPRSQRAATMQRIGQTEITIRYSRPVARGRTLFGDVVRWGRVWCPCADSATAITFSLPVRLEGRTIAAGTYTLWTIPDSAGAWTLIVSRTSASWHIPYPGDRHDLLRLPVHATTGPHVESLLWYFPAVDGLSATMALHWGTTILPLRIEVDR